MEKKKAKNKQTKVVEKQKKEREKHKLLTSKMK